MIVSQPKLVLDPYEWLPGYGESDVFFHSDEGLNVWLDIEYEREALDDGGREIILNMKRSMVFKRVRAFIKNPFPGIGFFKIKDAKSEFKLGVLTEFMQSEWVQLDLKNWHIATSHTPPAMRHFSIQFLSENLAFDILAKEVILLDEFPNNSPQE